MGKLLLTELITELTTEGEYLKTKRQMTGPDANLARPAVCVKQS
jgi:hypothetical protein